MTNEDLIQQAGKELQDLVQAFIDPSATKGKLAELEEAAIALWNLKDQIPEMDIKAVMIHLLVGALKETAHDYMPLA